VRTAPEPLEVVVHLHTADAPPPAQREAWRRLWDKLLAGCPPAAAPDEGHSGEE
jgi:hypothetical protein